MLAFPGLSPETSQTGSDLKNGPGAKLEWFRLKNWTVFGVGLGQGSDLGLKTALGLGSDGV